MAYLVDCVLVADRDFWGRRNQELKELREHYCRTMECSRLYRLKIGDLKHVIMGHPYFFSRVFWGYGTNNDPLLKGDWYSKMETIDDGPWIVLGLIDPKMVPVAKQMPDLFTWNPTPAGGRQSVRIGIYGYSEARLDGTSVRQSGRNIFENVVFLANQDYVCYAANLRDGKAARLLEKDWRKIRNMHEFLDESSLEVFYESATYSVKFAVYRHVIGKRILRHTSAIELMDSFILDGVLLD